jgi:hypothetical protein
MALFNLLKNTKPKSRFDRYHLTTMNQTRDEVFELSLKRCLFFSILIVLIVVGATFGLEQLVPTVDRSY